MMPSPKAGNRKTARPKARTPRAHVSAKPLSSYRRKRDFSVTGEPAGAAGPRPRRGLVYVIQKHHATHLHYDLRLEQGGVLKSWAIPKEPPLKPGEKRLAVEVEDHPLEYASFHGSIPKGEYGGGSVAIWDHGTYEPIETNPRMREFVLHGQKLKGTFVLVLLRPREGEKRKNWLFFKTKT